MHAGTNAHEGKRNETYAAQRSRVIRLSVAYLPRKSERLPGSAGGSSKKDPLWRHGSPSSGKREAPRRARRARAWARARGRGTDQQPAGVELRAVAAGPEATIPSGPRRRAPSVGLRGRKGGVRNHQRNNGVSDNTHYNNIKTRIIVIMNISNDNIHHHYHHHLR